MIVEQIFASKFPPYLVAVTPSYVTPSFKDTYLFSSSMASPAIYLMQPLLDRGSPICVVKYRWERVSLENETIVTVDMYPFFKPNIYTRKDGRSPKIKKKTPPLSLSEH